jgi:hypothetical protein
VAASAEVIGPVVSGDTHSDRYSPPSVSSVDTEQRAAVFAANTRAIASFTRGSGSAPVGRLLKVIKCLGSRFVVIHSAIPLLQRGVDGPASGSRHDQ